VGTRRLTRFRDSDDAAIRVKTLSPACIEIETSFVTFIEWQLWVDSVEKVGLPKTLEY